MSTPAPTPAAPAAVPPSLPVTPAAAPVTPPPPATPGPATPPPADPKAQDRGKRIWSLLQEESASEPGKKTEPKKPDEAPPAAPAPAAPAATPPEPPIRASKKAPIDKRPALPTASTPAAPAPVAAPTPPTRDDDFEASLIQEEKELIADAKEAESHLPGRKGLVKQTEKFIKEHQKYLNEHPDIDGNPDEELAYQRFLKKNRPLLSESEQREVSEKRIAARVSQPLQEKTQNLEHELFVRDEEPKIAQRGERIVSDLNSTAMPAEILEFAGKHGVPAAQAEYRDELKIHNEVVTNAAACYQELIRLATTNPKTGKPLAVPVVDPAADPAKYRLHQTLEKIMSGACEEFKESANQKELVRDGKWFVTREEWHYGYRNFPDKYWTFTNQEIADRSLKWVPAAIEAGIKFNREEMARRGYEKRKFTPAPNPPPAVPATPTNSAPGPGTSPVPAPNNGTPSPNTPGARMAAALAGG